jgi:hypothetical protein
MTRFAIAIPQFFADGQFDQAAFKSYLQRAEALGYDSGWTQEQVLGTMPTVGGRCRDGRAVRPCRRHDASARR